MTNQHIPVESPQPPLRRPDRARTNRPAQHPHPQAGRPNQPINIPQENTLSSNHPTPPEGAAKRRRSATEIQEALCNADQRNTDRGLRLLAGGILAGQPMPDPDRPRAQMRNFLNAAGAVLDEQPSERTARAAGLRLQHALTGLINETAGRKAC